MGQYQGPLVYAPAGPSATKARIDHVVCGLIAFRGAGRDAIVVLMQALPDELERAPGRGPTPTRARAAWTAETRASLRLAVPLALTQVGQIAITATDTVMMGWIGPEALAAGALAINVYLPLFLFALGIVTAVAPFAAQALGANRRREVRRVVRQGFWVAAAVGVPIAVVIWQARPILLALGQAADTAAMAESYVRPMVWGLVPALWFIVLRSFAAALDRPRPVMIFMFGGVAVNAVLDYGLMFGHFGFPAIGLAGAGAATSVAHMFMFFGLLAYVVRRRGFRRYAILVRLWRHDWSRFAQILRLGTPIGVTIIAEVGMFAAAAFLMGLMGTRELAAHAIALQCASIAFMVPLGISQAAVIRTGRAVGAGDRAGVGRAGWVAVALGAGFTTLTALLFLLAPWPLVGLFLELDVPGNRAVAEFAVTLLAIAALFQLVDGAQAICAGALRGLRDTRVPMVIAAIGYWGVGFIASVVLAFPLGLGGVGVWVGMALGLAVVAVLMLRRFHLRERLALGVPVFAPAQ